MTTFCYIGGIALLLIVSAILIACGMCACCDTQYMGHNEVLARIEGRLRVEGTDEDGQ